MAVSLRNRRWFRLLTHLCRIVFASTFIVSGFVKSIDPWGTALNVGNYLAAYDVEWLNDYAIYFSIWLCGAELMMGLMLLFKVRIRLISIFGLCSMLFFTVLTFLSATFIPIEDCGCFGDVLKLTPWQTFVKNVVLLPLIVVVWWRYRPDKILKMSRLEGVLTVLFCSLSMGLGLYCYRHLPLLDFLPYRKGVNIAEAMEEARTRQAESDVVLVYRNRRNGRLREFSLDDKAWHNEQKWEWVETRVLEDNPDRIEPTILEFNISSRRGDVTDSLLSIRGRLYMICVSQLSDIEADAAQRLRGVVERAAEERAAVVCLTSDEGAAERVAFAEGLFVDCFAIDAKTLKTMLRADVGLVVLRDGVIEEKLNWRDL